MSEQYSHDIFISFSFADQQMAEEIVNTLTSKYGFSCWICTRQVEGGRRYKALIPQAIDEARVVVFLQSENALTSKEIPKEIGIAFDADKIIIPFKIDQAQPQGDLRYDLYGVEYIDATVPTKEQRIYELAKAISKAIGKPLPSDAVPDAASMHLVSTPSVIPKSIFCGRDDVLEELHAKFLGGERVVFVQGIGGIGKTQIAKQYAKRYKANYDTIIFATYENALTSLICGEKPFELEPELPRLVCSDGTMEDDHAFFQRKLQKIQKLCDERTLIIIDNFDVEYDEALPQLLEGKYRLLITTRSDYSRTYPCIKVGPIDSIENLISVFMQNYQGYEVEEDDPDLVELIELVNRHTYTIELLAQHMENSGQSAGEMIQALQKEGILSLNEAVHDAGSRTQSAYKNLLRMFKVFELNEQEKKVLQYLSLMPLSGVPVRDFKIWAKLDSLKVLKELENRSWITRNTDGICLHPIIGQVVKHELPVTDENCADFVARFLETIDEIRAWHFTLADKEKYAGIASGIMEAFPHINEKTVALYKTVETLYSFTVKPFEAADLARRIYAYYEGASGKYSFDCGRAAFKAGWVYAFNLWMEDALTHATKWLELAAEIFGNIELDGVVDHATYGHTLVNFAKVQILTGEATGDVSYFDKARTYAQTAVEENVRWIPQGHPQYPKVAGGYMQLADVCIAQKRYEEAQKLNDDAYAILFPLFGENDSDTLHAMTRKVKILFGMERYEEALALSDKAVGIYAQFYKEVHSSRYDHLLLRLQCLMYLNRKAEAQELAAYLLNLARKIFAPGAKQLQDLQGLVDKI
ncbi:MAG: toll/interleukin-1 receptor domain-containing protein [Clostridia bacterium]|nr:toll/interleukin-1 receptor domain-containing protein [Clostridia bacterium]